MKAIITDISEWDAYHKDKDLIIGKVGTMEEIDKWDNGWFGCYFTFSDPITPEMQNSSICQSTQFYEIKYKKVKK